MIPLDKNNIWFKQAAATLMNDLKNTLTINDTNVDKVEELLSYDLDNILFLNRYALTRNFQTQWRRITQQNGTDAQVLPLWHATRYNIANEIFTNGFDYTKSNRHMHGKGVYQSVKTDYSVLDFMKPYKLPEDDHLYCRNDVVKVIILSLCITGVHGSSDSDIGKQHSDQGYEFVYPKQPNSEHRVNSLHYQGHGNEFYVFGETADMQCLPLCAYVFKFKK